MYSQISWFSFAAWVEALSAIVLIVLFLLQKFGTSRVSFLFSPIMGAWTFTTPLVGIYSIIHYYPSIFMAISPHYMFRFFSRNGKEGWLLLGGTVLCITGEPQFSWFTTLWSSINDIIAPSTSFIKTYTLQDRLYFQNLNSPGNAEPL